MAPNDPCPSDAPATPDRFTLDPASIANFVKLQRAMFGWKQDMLAAEAGVSLSTVTRVERGERVRPAQLRKLAAALKKPEDEFLRQRVRATPEEVADNLRGMFAWAEGRVPVEVAPLRTERRLRALVETAALLVDSDLGDGAAEDIANLREWLGLASFVQAERAGMIATGLERPVAVRTLWRRILECAAAIERDHRAICFAGTYAARLLHGGEPIAIAILSVRARANDPALDKLGTMWAPETIDERRMIADFLEGDD